MRIKVTRETARAAISTRITEYSERLANIKAEDDAYKLLVAKWETETFKAIRKNTKVVLQMSIIDGYGERLHALEGTRFKVVPNGDRFLVTVTTETRAFMKSLGISVTYWEREIAKKLSEDPDGIDGMCPTCHDDVDLCAVIDAINETRKGKGQ